MLLLSKATHLLEVLIPSQHLIHHHIREPQSSQVRFEDPGASPPVSLRLGHARGALAYRNIVGTDLDVTPHPPPKVVPLPPLGKANNKPFMSLF